jgi:hypothetical protein
MKDNTCIVIFTFFRANVHDEQNSSLIGPDYTNSANEGQGIFCLNKKPLQLALKYITIIYHVEETKLFF